MVYDDTLILFHKLLHKFPLFRPAERPFQPTKVNCVVCTLLSPFHISRLVAMQKRCGLGPPHAQCHNCTYYFRKKTSECPCTFPRWSVEHEKRPSRGEDVKVPCPPKPRWNLGMSSKVHCLVDMTPPAATEGAHRADSPPSRTAVSTVQFNLLCD